MTFTSRKQILRGTSHSLLLSLRVRPRTLDLLGMSFRTRVHEVLRMVDGQLLITVLPNLAVSCPPITNHCTSWLNELLNNWHQCSGYTVLDLHEEYFVFVDRSIPPKTQTPSRMTPTIVTQYFSAPDLHSSISTVCPGPPRLGCLEEARGPVSNEPIDDCDLEHLHFFSHSSNGKNL